MNAFYKHGITVFLFLLQSACIAPDNETVEGTGTPDITTPTRTVTTVTTTTIDPETGEKITTTEEVVVCSPIKGILDGASFIPSANASLGNDGRKHPDIFYLGWSRLDERTDLRFPAKGYDDAGFEDLLLVSRRQSTGEYKTWQIWPPLDNDCLDTEKIRIHSFDVAPDGQSLFVSMSREEIELDEDGEPTGEDANPNKKLGIYRLDIAEQVLTKISKDNTVDFLNPTYVGNDPNNSDHETLLVAKTVNSNEIPLNYDDPDDPFEGTSVLQDEYDRAGTPLIHRMDAETGDVVRIGFNNSHQVEPFVTTDITTPNNPIKIVAFTQWEHQASVNRFALWKTQIDGSDNFTFYGEEASTDDTDPNISQGREIKSGPYKNYVMMTQGARANANFASEGHIIMTKRGHLDLRSPRIFLQTLVNTGVDQGISFSPEYYNDESFVYAYREGSGNTHSLHIKDFPEATTDTDGDGFSDTPDLAIYSPQESDEFKVPTIPDRSAGTTEVLSGVERHLVMPRSFYLPDSQLVSPTTTDITSSRSSFTNTSLNGASGFLVQNLTQSDNGFQNQLDGIDSSKIRLQFFIPSHHFNNSKVINTDSGSEISIPVGGFMQPNADGSIGAILKEGLYVWKVHKGFNYTNDPSDSPNLWLPVRAEVQEVSFVKDRVNACNQCHQDRNQANIDFYENVDSTASGVMKGDLSSLKGTEHDLSNAVPYHDIPDFHKDIVPLFTSKKNGSDQACATCHNENDKLNLSNTTGVSSANAMFRTLVQGSHKLDGSETTIPYVSRGINPLGMGNNSQQPAPFFWSLLLNDDLTLAPGEDGYSGLAGRNLDKDGDYGAEYVETVATEIANINTNEHNHLGHWSVEDMQKFITYTTTQTAVGLSNHISFTSNSIDRGDAVAQKAYQSLRRNCFSCHNDHPDVGIDADGFGKPKEKRFTSDNLLTDRLLRFVVDSHVAEKDDTKFSSLTWESDITNSMSNTLLSASYRINFDDTDKSELLVYARNDTDLNDTVNHSGFAGLTEGSADYIAIKNWVTKTSGVVNNPPTIDDDVQDTITIKEYDEPAFQGQAITWSDLDNTSPPEHELSQLFLSSSGTSEHSINDTMVALEYDDFESAKIKTYAILGDRGDQNLEFTISDGIKVSANQELRVKVTSDYDVPAPSSQLPDAFAFYTKRADSELRKLDTDGSDVSVGILRDQAGDTLDITGWTTVYRRIVDGSNNLLYFFNQEEQKVYVVDETTAVLQSTITLDHSDEKRGDKHKQTVYLIWWREAEGLVGDAGYTAGGLEGLLESKLSSQSEKNGDFHVDLGNPTEVDAGNEVTINVDYKTKLKEGDVISAYVWRRATFMSKWTLNEVDSLHVLNLVTGKPKTLTDFTFEAQTVDGIDYEAATYANVRAVVVAQDGAFYGFNKDINDDVVVFNFDPIAKTQKVVDSIPSWIETYLNNPFEYGTPFLVINNR